MAAKKKKTVSKPVKKQTKKETCMKYEFTSLFIIVAGLLLGVFLYAPSGIVGEWMQGLALGLFGIPAYVLPVFVIVLGVHRFIGKAYREHKNKYIQISVLILIVSGIFHLFSGVGVSNPFRASSISFYWSYGTYGIGGGVLGGVLCDLLANAVGKIATGIILFTAVLVIIMILTKWSPLKALLRVIVKAVLGTQKVKQMVISEKEAARKSELALRKQQKALAEEAEPENTISSKIIKKPYEEKDYIPESIRNIAIEEDAAFDFGELDQILDRALPEEVKEMQEASEDVPPFDDAPEMQEEAGREEEKQAGETEEKADPLTLEEKEEIAQEFEEVFEKIPYTYPTFSLLDSAENGEDLEDSRQELKENASKLISTLKSFNVEAKLLNVSRGPAVTRYELKPGDGVKVSKFVGLADDISLRLAASGVRIEAPIPNKEAVGIEIPNKTVAVVNIKEVLDSPEFSGFSSKLAFALGKDIAGKNVVVDLAKMPHLLIAGATGSGKSVCINTLITSILYKADPNEVKLLMIDPKVVELGIYNGIPHLMIPVVTDPRRASGALYWAVQEMTRRYAIFAENDVRNLDGYNQMIKDRGEENTMPHIVIIIDELADLMMVAPGEVEDSICRLAQMARAAGMHLVIATQRPSVDVITGIIKANIPSRIAFAVSSQVDSRTILDAGGAEKLLGRGDMLFSPVGSSKATRLQGAFISDKEVERVVEFVKSGSVTRYDEDVLEKIENGKTVAIEGGASDEDDCDELLPRAIEIAVDTGKISASYLQRRLKIGFSRAARIVDQMEERGWIGPQDGSKPREVLLSKEDYLEMSIQS